MLAANFSKVFTKDSLKAALARMTSRGSTVGWVHLALFIALVGLFTQDNRFPFYYHPDEGGKLEQLLESKLNFHHPLLMLNSVAIGAGLPLPATLDRQEYKRAVAAGRYSMSRQDLVIVGRTVNACFAAGAIVTLSLLAWFTHGWVASLLMVPLLVVGTDLIVYARYLKEDPSLLFGLAVVFLALWNCERRLTPGSAGCLGIACGLAASGKYVGICALAFALPTLWFLQRRTWPRGETTNSRTIWTFFAASFFGTMLLVNLQFLWGILSFKEGMSSEFEKLAQSQDGLTRQVPHALQWKALWASTALPALACAALAPLAHVLAFRKAPPVWTITLFIFPWAYCGMLSFSSKAALHYLLPCQLFVQANAGLTLAALVGAKRTDRLLPIGRGGLAFVWLIRTGAGAALLASILVPEWKAFHLARLGFRQDNRLEMVQFIAAHVPPDSVIAHDKKAKLPNDPRRPAEDVYSVKMPQEVRSVGGLGFISDLGELDTLRDQMGITHLVVCETDFGRFFRGTKTSARVEVAPDVARRRTFYARLFSEGELLLTLPRGINTNLSPELSLYRISGTGLSTAKKIEEPFAAALPEGHPGRR